MYTFHDFTRDAALSIPDAVEKAITSHRTSEAYKVALDADTYDAQRNSTITKFMKKVYDFKGVPRTDSYATNHRLCSNFFNRLNTQRVTYSLGNGVQFAGEGVKEKLGQDFDVKLQHAGYFACIHSMSFMFWNLDRVHVFKFTEFAPLYDEETGAMRAGVRFWQLASDKPSQAVLYEEDGFTVFEGAANFGDMVIKQPKRSYKLTIGKAPADLEPEIIGEENYGSLPIIPVYGSRLHQSTLVGMKGMIDAYDLVRSGFANDLSDCSEIYWLINNAGGMDDGDLAQFLNRIKFNHIAAIPDADDVAAQPYTQEVPFQSRKVFLDEIRNGLYEDFGALDVHTVSAGATNDHIDAAYQPMDENADDFELQIITAVQLLLGLIGIEDTPIFKRNRISNEREITEMILSAANYLDDETVLQKLPFVSPEEVDTILDRKVEEGAANYQLAPEEEPEE